MDWAVFHHFSQSSSILAIRVAQPGRDATSQDELPPTKFSCRYLEQRLIDHQESSCLAEEEMQAPDKQCKQSNIMLAQNKNKDCILAICAHI